jgi:hypothetical protein
MHEPHRVFDSIENQVVVSISPPLANPSSNFSHVFPFCSLSLHHVLNQRWICFQIDSQTSCGHHPSCTTMPIYIVASLLFCCTLMKQ